MYNLGINDYDKALYLDAARMCGSWLVNTQNTPDHPWGDIIPAEQSADYGRFNEKSEQCRNYRRPAGVWLIGIYIAGLLDLIKTPILGRGQAHNAVKLGARYLKSLQCFDSRWEKAVGGFHETVPGCSYSAPRDAASGCMGLISLYLDTGEEEYLKRSLAFAEWYSTHGSDKDGYPWDDYDLEKGEGTSRLRGDWQAGGALVYYELWHLTGDEKWKDALITISDVLVTICENDPGTDTPYNFHGNCVISKGNDDFANLVLFAAFMITGDEKYKDLAAKRIRDELTRQADNGAFPGYGGTSLTALELIEALDLYEAGYEILPPDELREPIDKALACCIELQERENHDPFLMGGVYGQANYATTRDVIHGRDVGYALNLFLRAAGYRASAYTLLGWDSALANMKAKLEREKG